jgi:atypical dual specificity phosphatase
MHPPHDEVHPLPACATLNLRSPAWAAGRNRRPYRTLSTRTQESRTRQGMDGFYWLIENALAGCPRPGSRRGRAADGDALDTDLGWLCEQGIGALVSMTETPLDEAAIARCGLATLHLPVDDLHAPTPAQLHYALRFIDEQRALGRRVAVHCLMGQGRTGTILAAYLIRGGSSAEDALLQLRAICPGAISAKEQEEALRTFAERRDWLI